MNWQISLNNINPIKYFFWIAILMGFVFTFIASTGMPDDKNTPNFLIRLFQWQLQSIVPIALMVVSQIGLSKLHIFARLNPWFGIVISGVLGATLFSPIALWLDLTLGGEAFPSDLFAEIADEWFAVVLPSTLFWVLINAPWVFGMNFAKDTKNTKDTPESKTKLQKIDQTLYLSIESDETALEKGLGNKGLFQQISPIRPSDILRLSSELHYIDVVSMQDHKLVLYSLKEAIKEINPEMGLQVHRSHWVAYKAIKHFEKKGRQGQIMLINGDQIPVSRSLLQKTESLIRARQKQ